MTTEKKVTRNRRTPEQLRDFKIAKATKLESEIVWKESQIAVRKYKETGNSEDAERAQQLLARYRHLVDGSNGS